MSRREKKSVFHAIYLIGDWEVERATHAIGADNAFSVCADGSVVIANHHYRSYCGLKLQIGSVLFERSANSALLVATFPQGVRRFAYKYLADYKRRAWVELVEGN